MTYNVFGGTLNLAQSICLRLQKLWVGLGLWNSGLGCHQNWYNSFRQHSTLFKPKLGKAEKNTDFTDSRQPSCQQYWTVSRIHVQGSDRRLSAVDCRVRIFSASHPARAQSTSATPQTSADENSTCKRDDEIKIYVSVVKWKAYNLKCENIQEINIETLMVLKDSNQTQPWACSICLPAGLYLEYSGWGGGCNGSAGGPSPDLP